jgi:hypothetical protein
MKNNSCFILSILSIYIVMMIISLVGCGGGNDQNITNLYTKYVTTCTQQESTLLFTKDGKVMPYESLTNGNIKPFYYDSKCKQNPISLGNTGDIVQAKVSFTSDGTAFSPYRINADGSLNPVNL